MTSNPRSRLVETFQRGFMDDLADQNELDAAHAIEEDLDGHLRGVRGIRRQAVAQWFID